MSNPLLENSKETKSNEKVSGGNQNAEAASLLDRNAAEEPGRVLWRPFILTPWIPAVLCVVLLIVGVGLEVAFYLTNQRKGWSLPPDPTNKDSLHYAYTWLPVVMVMFIITVFTSADFFIMKMQPYVDLAKRTGASGESLLQDYNSEVKSLVWLLQIRNGHYVAALSTIVLLLLMVMQPLASSLLVVRNTQIERDPMAVPKFGTLGLNGTLSTLQGFASAAGFAEADARYDIGRPPFVWQAWTVDEFQRPSTNISNGTMQALTTAILQKPNCAAAEQISYTGTQLSGSWQGCTVSLSFDSTADSFSGIDITRNCTAADIVALDDRAKPVYFWFATRNPPAASLVFCRPKLSLHNVLVTANIANGSLINVVPTSVLTESAVDVYNPPFNGQPFTGVEYGLSGASADTLLRANITQLQLPASVMRVMEREGLAATLANPAQVVTITATRYELFLALSARSNYFVTATDGSELLVSITEIQQRLWMSTLSTHIMAVIMLVGGILAGIVHFAHHRERRNVRLYAPPGSIAVAASVTRDSPVNGMIGNGWDQTRLRGALKDEKFGMDSAGRIVRISDGH